MPKMVFPIKICKAYYAYGQKSRRANAQLTALRTRENKTFFIVLKFSSLWKWVMVHTPTPIFDQKHLWESHSVP